MTRGGVATGVDQEAPYGQLQVQPVAQKKAPFDVQKEKEVFLDERQEFVKINQASTSVATPPKGPILWETKIHHTIPI